MAPAGKPKSSPVKQAKNVASHDSEEVAAKVLPEVMEPIKADLFFELRGQSGEIDVTPTKFVPKPKVPAWKIVKYLNELSEAVREKDDRK
jgi:hypothetical protein